MRGYASSSHRPTGAKDVRARPVAAAAENGLLRIVRGRHTNDFLDELTAFPHAKHDDCVDALAGAHTQLSQHANSNLEASYGYIPSPLDSLLQESHNFSHNFSGYL